MSIGEVLLTHSIARREKKLPYFFSRFNLERMKDAGNTHFCFYCGGGYGFTPGPKGEATNCGKGEMLRHDPVTHAPGIIGGADKHKWKLGWLEESIKPNFPFIVSVPSTL